jgi:hypothetical protein
LSCKDEQTMKRWRSGRDKKASAPLLPQAANGRYYLPPGTYRLEVDAGDGRKTFRQVVIRGGVSSSG